MKETVVTGNVSDPLRVTRDFQCLVYIGVFLDWIRGMCQVGKLKILVGRFLFA